MCVCVVVVVRGGGVCACVHTCACVCVCMRVRAFARARACVFVCVNIAIPLLLPITGPHCLNFFIGLCQSVMVRPLNCKGISFLKTRCVKKVDEIEITTHYQGFCFN